MRRSTFLGQLTLAGMFATRALSAAGPDDKVSAEALFGEGRKLVEAGQFSEACPKFEASQRLDPGVGTMLYLADCYEKTGRTASAWAEFREASAAAHNAGSADREKIARDRADALEPRLAYLTIVPWKGQPVLVTRDGNRVEEAALGSAIPVDPGTHVVVAAASGKREWSTTVLVADAARVSVAVPILPDEMQGSAAPLGTVGPPAPAPAADHGSPGSTQRTLGVVAAGVGVVGVGVGVIFGLKAQSTWSDAQAECPSARSCTAEGSRLSDDASSAAGVSTVGFVVGAVGLAGGAVLWFTAPKADSGSGVSASIGPGRILVGGRF